MSKTPCSDFESMIKYKEDFDFFHAISGEIHNKYNNEFVAVKNVKVYHNASPLKLLELPKADE